MTEQPTFKLVIRDNEWLKEFSFNWYSKLIVGESPYWERYALISHDQYITMSLIKQIVVIIDGKMHDAGYVVVPSFEQDILTSIYVLPSFRKYGICTWVIEELNIKRLSCITENVNALRLYKKLGFTEVQTNDPFKGSVKLQRN